MKTKLRILVDDCIPFIRGVLEPVADVCYLSAVDFTPDAVATADALIVRTRTRCDAALLAASSVRFVATATIGFDHIDADFCRDKGIVWTYAAGCNATSVAQYVASALSAWAQRAHIDLCSKTLGVVGVGHVGSAVCDVAKLLGMKVLCNDPLRSEPDFVSLDEFTIHGASRSLCLEASFFSTVANDFVIVSGSVPKFAGEAGFSFI